MPSAFEDGAQSAVALRPRSLIVELGLLSVWTACVRRRQGKGVCRKKPCTEGLVFGRSREPRSARQNLLRE
ncbi:MAG: hypothetical protein AMK69_19610 [Nitrospira bacterium SG8_3]|nr:MAG: hypothetical protein AMK69_19610 [Nitrospira bacterium SG8_3]